MEELAREASSPALALEYLYQLAGVLGSELQRLSDLFGPSAVAGLVPQVVCLLELLEALAAAGGGTGDADGGFARKTELAEALYLAVHNRQRETGVGIPGGRLWRAWPGANAEFLSGTGAQACPLFGLLEGLALQLISKEEALCTCPDAASSVCFVAPGAEDLVIEQKLSEAQKREQLLQIHLAQLEEENQRLLAQLAGSQSQDSTLRKEREVMLRLKEVVDKQRDEIRAQAHEILLKAGDTEALQEQLNRFMSMNEELRHKLAVVQMQLKKALEKTEALESVVLETRQELSRLAKTGVATESSVTGMEEGAVASGDQGPSPRTTAYSKEELQQILQERNELKTNLFLVQEELAYYQRELLNDERIPSLLLDAMKSTIKKQRKKIRAKMLGTVEEPVSSDEEEEGVCLTASGSDCVDGHLPESRIKSFFGLWYGSNSSNRSSSSAACPEPWEIVGPQDTVAGTAWFCYPILYLQTKNKMLNWKSQGGNGRERGTAREREAARVPLLLPGWGVLAWDPTRMWALLLLLLFSLQIQGPGRGSCASELDPNGRHVCRSSSHPQVFTCCLGWKQKGQECTIALCQGADACQKDEVCVRPGVCRCKPGFFGANCNTREYWAGGVLTSTGAQTAKRAAAATPMGSVTQSVESAPATPTDGGGSASLHASVAHEAAVTPSLGPASASPVGGLQIARSSAHAICLAPAAIRLQASASATEAGGAKGVPSTAPAMAHPVPRSLADASAGLGCGGLSASTPAIACTEPAAPRTDTALVRPATEARAAQTPALLGPTDLNADTGVATASTNRPALLWTAPALPVNLAGTEPTAISHAHPDAMGKIAPSLVPTASKGKLVTRKQGNAGTVNQASLVTGVRCPAHLVSLGMAADSPAWIASMGAVTQCLGNACARLGSGASAAMRPALKDFTAVTAPSPASAGGPNATLSLGTVSFIQGLSCSRLLASALKWLYHNVCRGKNQEALIAGILTPLLLLLLCICCCCFCCCGSAPMDPGDRAAAADGNPVSRMKHHVLGALANLSSTLPCFSLGGYKLPRVTVSHHDAEIPFNPSFIEPPSAAWPLDSSFSSSFDTDNEDDHPEGPVYQLPAAPDAELQPGFLPEASALNLEPFAIPRTSSIAKAKRPSVSFAEGTRFEGQTRGSSETLNPLRKSKASWGLARVASPQQEILPDSSDSSPGNIYENVEAGPKEEEEEKESHRPFLRSTPGGRRKRISGSRNVAQRVEALEAASKAQDKEPVVTTIYMTVGKAAGGSEGPVQAILQQLGSLQRAKQPPRKEPRLRRSLEGLQNPTRRMQDLEKSTRMLLTPDKTDLETTTMHDPELATMKAEGQGLLGGLPAPSWEETGESKSCEITRSHNQPERVIGGGALEEKTKEGEPKYENVSGLVQYPLAT
ncbi:hypothetical protein lerEdw1_002681 [Lerista edwardsae]|nr:hypothetical protein lerEdw1_002681 [Lerista edwardsae]